MAYYKGKGRHKKPPPPPPTGGRPKKVPYSYSNPRPGATKRLTYDQALEKARRLLGPDGAVRFIRTKREQPAWSHTHHHWYRVGVVFVDQADGVERQLFGEVGSGTTWRKALADATRRVRQLAREQAKEGAK